MRAAHPARSLLQAFLAAVLAAAAPAAAAETPAFLSAVLRIDAKVPAGARTAAALGTDRRGTGVVIDDDGLVLTIGYLVLEASEIDLVLDGGRRVSASLVAYDHDTGFGLVRADRPLGTAALSLGESAGLQRGSPALAASYGGEDAVLGVYVVARRRFAGWWEYMLDRAIFTAPPHPLFGGAALLDRDGRLVGIGSLAVPDAVDPGKAFPGNVFVPVDALKPVLGDLIADGRAAAPPRPWLGLYPQAALGRVFVVRAPPDGPAARAGIAEGDVVLGVAGTPVSTLPEYYGALWSAGPAGTEIALDLLRGDRKTTVRLRSIDRRDWFAAASGNR